MIWTLTSKEHIPVEQDDESKLIENCLKAPMRTAFDGFYWLTEAEAVNASIQFHTKMVQKHQEIINSLESRIVRELA